MDQKKIIFCECAQGQVLPEGTKRKVWAALEESRVDFEGVADLCGLAAREDGRLAEWAAEGKLMMAACFGRAVKWLLHGAGVELPVDSTVLNMRELPAEEVIEKLLENQPLRSTEQIKGPEESVESVQDSNGWAPWFPVIDYDLCVDCMQCLNFCLFGVYEESADGKVRVKNPRNCKLNCPACARVCPEVAIIFPKYNKSPINGDEVSEASKRAEKVGVNIGAVLQGDVYTTLRNRNRRGGRRFAGKTDAELEDNPAQKRVRPVALQEQLDIPDEVIASLTNKESSTSTPSKEKRELIDCDCDCEKAAAWAENGVVDHTLCDCEDCPCRDDEEKTGIE